MRWSPSLRSLKRGVRVATRLIRTLKRTAPRAPAPKAAAPTDRLVVTPSFGANPGKLRMMVHLPTGGARVGQPLVVLLHGCGQDALQFARASGWIDLCDHLGCALVLPEQAKANNRLRCFHWFRPSDIARDRGEAASIAAMTRAAIRRYGSDPERVFVVGLSAGGAMAAAVLAAYPELFAAGAAVAGLPVGSASTGMQALMRMSKAGPDQSRDDWVRQVRRVSGHRNAGRWPRLSIWQGSADTVVAPDNAVRLAAQWRALHGLPDRPEVDALTTGSRHQVWGDKVELWTLPGLPHAYPSETAGAAHVAASSTPATRQIARFWGLS
jgi:poly(hydroxyalkanoate) depolymerase family esterase